MSLVPMVSTTPGNRSPVAAGTRGAWASAAYSLARIAVVGAPVRVADEVPSGLNGAP